MGGLGGSSIGGYGGMMGSSSFGGINDENPSGGGLGGILNEDDGTLSDTLK
jgi:hypothetical protein